MSIDERVTSVMEEYEGLHELHSEYVDVITDTDDPEVLGLWVEIEGKLQSVSEKVDKLGTTSVPTAAEVESIEIQVDELSSLYWELAAELS